MHYAMNACASTCLSCEMRGAVFAFFYYFDKFKLRSPEKKKRREYILLTCTTIILIVLTFFLINPRFSDKMDLKGKVDERGLLWMH